MRAFCAACGERRLTAADRSLPSFVMRSAAGIADLEGPGWRTIKNLFFRPGVLTCQWLEGRRRRQWSPGRIVVLATVFYFLIQPLTNVMGFTAPLDSQLCRQFYTEALGMTEIARAHLGDASLECAGGRLDTERWNEQQRAWMARYDLRSELLARSLVFLLVPMLAVGIAMAQPRRPLLDAVVLASHFTAFMLVAGAALFYVLVAHVVAPIVAWLLSRFPALASGEAVYHLFVEFGLFLVVGPWLYVALQRVYAIGPLRAGLTTAGLLAWFLLSLLSYRALLFFLTVYTQ